MTKKLWVGWVLGSLFILAASPASWACYGVIVGKKASADGAVLLGHNEQDAGKYFLNFRKVPRRQHAPGERVTLRGGAQVPQVRETYAFLWSECPGLAHSDGYLNEWGVAIVSNGCSDRENGEESLKERGQLVEGGISYLLRRLAIERSKTAREAVEIVGELVEKVGYAGARTLTIADSNEAWLLAMTRGKHWVAQRLPDDEVALMPNFFTIGEIDLADSTRFLGAPDLIEYAVAQGWYDPAAGKPFRFWEVYGPSRKTKMDPRQWRGQCLVTGQDIERSPDRALPFSVKPAHKMSLRDVTEVLRYHGSPSLCKSASVEAAVFQLRSGMPPDVGCVYWRASAEACTSVFTPWYAGISEVPAGYSEQVDLERHLSLEHHFDDSAEKYRPRNDRYWWVFRRLQNQATDPTRDARSEIRSTWSAMEDKIFSAQPQVEREAMEVYRKNPEAARQFLTDYCRKSALEAVKTAEELLKE